MLPKFYSANAELQSILEQILEETGVAFPQLAPNQIAVTWILYEPPYRVNTGGALTAEEFWQYQPKGASYRGVELMNPGGLVALFYLVAMNVWLEQGMVSESAEIVRSLTDMMTSVSPDAVSYLIDVLSGTTSGPELSPGPNAAWQQQRNIVNRYFHQLGWPELRAINVNQKIWRDRPYGRERDFAGPASENRNLLTTDAIARLFHSIIGGVSVSSVRSQAMMALMKKTDLQKTDCSAFFSGVANLLALEDKTNRGIGSTVYVESETSHPYQLVILVENPQTQTASAAHQQDEITAFVSQRIFAAAQQAFHTAFHTEVC